MNMKWKKLKSRNVLVTDHINVRKDVVRLPNGLVMPDYYVTEMKSVALVIPLFKDQSVLMVKQYRYGPNKILFEFPAGTLKSSKENPLKVAKKELAEETGYKAKKYHYLGKFYEYPTKDTHALHLYYATDLNKIFGGSKLEKTEQISLHKFTLNEVLKLIENNKIQVLGSVTAFLLTMRMIKYK